MKASELLDLGADRLMADLRNPVTRAGLFANFVVSMACAKTGMRLVPSVILAVSAQFAAEKLYVVIDDVHKAAIATQRLALASGNADPGQD